MARPATTLLLATLLAAGACSPAVQPPAGGAAPSATPADPIPQFGADGPSVRDCYSPRVRALGVPRQVPVPATAVVQGPDTYAGAYGSSADGALRRIQGTGFAYEVGSPAGLVAGFHEACLQPYGPAGWRRLRGRAGDVLFRIPRPTGPDAVVLVAGAPIGSLVVVFVEWRLTPGP